MQQHRAAAPRSAPGVARPLGGNSCHLLSAMLWSAVKVLFTLKCLPKRHVASSDTGTKADNEFLEAQCVVSVAKKEIIFNALRV